MRKIVLCIHDEKPLTSLKNRLKDQGVAEIITSSRPSELYGDALKAPPQAAVLEYPDPAQDMRQAVKKLWDRFGIPIIIVTESSNFEAVQRWEESMVSAILAKPVREDELIAALVLSVATTCRIAQLKAEISILKENIESRKIIEKAKGLLIERDRLTEAEAFRRMRSLSMERRISMRQLADAILLTNQIGG